MEKVVEMEMSRVIYKRIQSIKGKNALKKHAPVRYKELQKELQKVQRERQDILHMLELLDDLSEEEYIRLSLEVRKVQQERRNIKDEIEYYKELVKIVKDEVKVTYKLIRETLNEVSEKLEERVYYVRERNDLQDFIRGSIVESN